MDRATLLLSCLTLPIIGMVVAGPAAADTVVKLSDSGEPSSLELLPRRVVLDFEDSSVVQE